MPLMLLLPMPCAFDGRDQARSRCLLSSAAVARASKDPFFPILSGSAEFVDVLELWCAHGTGIVGRFAAVSTMSGCHDSRFSTARH